MSNIRIFSKIGIVQVYDKTIKAKLDNRGIHCMFIGYSKDHKEDVYRMLNLKTLKGKNTQDVLWLNKSYGEWKGIEEDKVTKILIPDELSSGSESSKSENDDNMEQK